MLDRKEKQRIKSEEAFRASLQKVPGKPITVWSVLNSAFVIWLLSTIILGGFTWIYNGWQASLRNEEEIHKLDIEVDGRFDRAERNSTFTLSKTPSYPADILLLPPGPQNAIQPEFANRNLKSLLYDLNARLPLEEQGDVMLALVEIKNMENYLINKELTGEPLHEFHDRIYAIHNTRWKWDQMSQRELHIYNRPVRWTLWLSYFLLVLSAGILIGLVQRYRTSRLKGITS